VRLLVLLALAGCTEAGGTKAQAAPPVDPVGERATDAGRTNRVLLTGELEATDSIGFDVPVTEAWQLSIRWMAEDGTPVKTGDKVLELDNSVFTQGLEEKKVAVKEAESTLRAARDLAALTITTKENELAQKKIAVERAAVLASVPADLLPTRTVQQRKLDLERAKVDVAKAEAELETERKTAALAAKVQQIALEKARRTVATAEKSIGDLVMTAPRDGLAMVGEHPWEQRPFQTGDVVQPGFVVVTMPNLTKALIVSADLSDVDDGRIAVGMTGTCTLDAYPRDPVPCTVTDLAPVARSVRHDSLRRAFAVRLSLATTDHERMKPGMSVKVELPGKAWP